MAKNQQEKADQAPAEPVVSDSAMTLHGVTVGDMREAADEMRDHWLNEQKKTAALEDSNRELGEKAQNLEHAVSVLETSVAAKDTHIQQQCDEIAKLREMKAPPTPQQVAEAIRRQQGDAMTSGLVRKEGGSIVTVVTIPPEVAEPLLSWADTAGEDPAEYVQKTLNEALLAYTSS